MRTCENASSARSALPRENDRECQFAIIVWADLRRACPTPTPGHLARASAAIVCDSSNPTVKVPAAAPCVLHATVRGIASNETAGR
jgi:hypothetical protein